MIGCLQPRIFGNHLAMAKAVKATATRVGNRSAVCRNAVGLKSEIAAREGNKKRYSDSNVGNRPFNDAI